jgi:Peptidase A4 family
MSRFGIFNAVVITATLAFTGTPADALGDAATSANWAGYVAHRSGVNFRSVAATWNQPAAVCDTQYPTYSAIWVGLGGFQQNSNALEQVGTELDCGASGIASASAWYELVPAPDTRIGMTIRTGDTIKASVTVTGRRVTVKLTDTTRQESFSKTVTAASVDLTSADWIVEAPSECSESDYCRTLPLTDFEAVSLSGATTDTTTGHRGAISSPLWGRTRITLVAEGRAYIVFGVAAQVTPSALGHGGSAFKVDYSQTTGSQARSRSSPSLPRLRDQRLASSQAADAAERSRWTLVRGMLLGASWNPVPLRCA